MKNLEDLIASKEFVRLGCKTTVCFITLKNGFEIVGTSACVNPEDFDKEIGEKWAEKDAMDQLEKYEGYRRQDEVADKKRVLEEIEKMREIARQRK